MQGNRRRNTGFVPSTIEEYERQIFDLKQLIEISKGLNSTLEYNVLIESILFTCMGQMQVLKAGIFLLKALDDNSFVLHRGYKGFELDHSYEYMIHYDSELLAVFNQDLRCYTMEELDELLGASSRSLRTLKKIKPCLIVPLKGKGTLNGIIVLGERINNLPFSDHEKEFMINISSLGGIAIQNAYLYELATTDMMTKLKIHHYFQTVLMEERERAVINKTSLSLIMLDIDHFKLFNDQHGHLCGDIVLKDVARVIRDNCRQIDIAARYGGEEMTIVLPNTDIEAALLAAERVRRNIERLVVEHDEKLLSVTVSLGVTQFDPERDRSNQSIIERADKALYASKTAGRNRVSFL
jgi:diguanylate cyclase (GGDEF)-like protein